MERIKRSQTYPIFSFYLFTITAILSILNVLMNNKIVNVIIFLFIVFGMISYLGFIHKINEYLLLLVEVVSNIIDQKDEQLPYIDGEGSIAVLYSYLSILDTRMKNLLFKLQQEQMKLKEYVEDISHQIKTPLTSMMLAEEMLLEESDSQLLLSIYHSTEKIKDLIEVLLHLAQVESHSIQYHKSNYSLDDLLNQIQDHLASFIEQYNVQLNYSTDSYIYCDEIWMSEALENIIKNCIEQGNNIDIHTQEYSSYTEIYIHDDGKGFDKKDLPNIFKRFYKTNSKGIGIGLSLSKYIIDDHHGSIEAYNQNGALFKITLPKKITKNKVSVTV